MEWDNQANKSVSGLDLLHRMDFPKLVRKIYSSSSASHTFFVLSDDSIFALGMSHEFVQKSFTVLVIINGR